MTNEAPITTTLKAPGANNPWMVIRSENLVQLKQQTMEIVNSGIFADLANAQEALAAAFNVGAILGGSPINPPQDTGAFTPPAPAAPAAPTQEELFAQFLATQNGAPAAQPAWSQPAAPAPAANNGTPGAPMVAGMPAKLVSGTSAKGAWQAWADPRPKDATDHMQKTDDVNHPGLNGGTHKLWKFIR